MCVRWTRSEYRLLRFSATRQRKLRRTSRAIARTREETHSSGGTARPANIYMEMGTPVQKKNIQGKELRKTRDAWWRGKQDASPRCRTWEARQDGERPGPDLSGPLHRLSAECSASRADKRLLSVRCGKCDSSRVVQHACSTLDPSGSAPQSRRLTMATAAQLEYFITYILYQNYRKFIYSADTCKNNCGPA